MNSKLFQLFIVLIVIISLVVPGGSTLAAPGVIAAARSSTAGSLDLSFGNNGKVLTDFGNSDDVGDAVALQSDGKILVAGDGLARYNTNGTLDLTFGTNGKVAAFTETYGVVDTMTLQPDGRIIVAGYSIFDGFYLERYNGDGSLDTTFGVDGKVTTMFGAGPTLYDYVRSLVVQSDGKILAAGVTGDPADFALARYNSDGSLDTTFDTDGKVTTDFGGSDNGYSLVLQPDGKMIVAGCSWDGASYDFALARYNNDGSLDTTFDSDGKLVSNLGGNEFGSAVTLQADGKIVMAGSTDPGTSNSDFIVARYNVNGSLDISFDGDGKAITAFGSSLVDEARAIAIQSNGKIVVLGSSGQDYFTYADFALARYNANGSLDTTFDGDGKLTTAVGSGSSNGNALALQPDGRIVAVGGSYNGLNADFAVVRYNTNGSLDTTFYNSGKVTTDFGGGKGAEVGNAIAFQTDGKIVVAGSTKNNDLGQNFALARYTSDGSLDPTFGTDGKVTTGFGINEHGVGYVNSGNAVAIQQNGKILVAGTNLNGGRDSKFALARYNTDGSLDTSFDGDGKVTTVLGAEGQGKAVAIQPDGKIVVAGDNGNPNETYCCSSFALARYNPNGSLDTSFDGDGQVFTSFGGFTGNPGTSLDSIQAVAIQPNGKIVVVGTNYKGGSSALALARYNANGSPDTTFDGDGKLTTIFSGSNGYSFGSDLVIQPDGKILVTGKTRETDINLDLALARYNANGSLDTTFGSGGKVVTDVGDSLHNWSLLLRPDGKFFLAGYRYANSSSGFALVLYNSNGSVDTTFGTNGIATVDFGGDRGGDAALQPDGKIVMVGGQYIGDYQGQYYDYDFALARFIGDSDSTIYYVKQGATGLNNGSSWTNAFTDLQSALAAAESDDEIWVAAGTYVPTDGSDRTISFALKSGVVIYGGFAGTETTLDQRDPAANVTILSGDLNGDDEANFANNSDNSYHVVVGSGTDNSAVLDGFTITAGNASASDYSSSDSSGGGMYTYIGSPTIRNVIFNGNAAFGWGGGMYNGGEAPTPPQPPATTGNGSHPILTNVIFSNNSARNGGGMKNENYSNPVLTNVIFTGNTASRVGGGMENYYFSNPTLTNVVFDKNTAGVGGGMTNTGSHPTLTNVTFSANSAEWGGAMANGYGSPVITNATFYGNSADTYGGAISNESYSYPVLTNVTINGNTATTYGGGISNDATSGSTDKGSTTILNGILYGNTGGEIYNASTPASVTYSIIQGGYTGTGNLDVDPRLGPLQDNGGFTQTMALGADSPAIDAGTDTGCPTTDQRGVSRPRGARCDMGAVEFTDDIAPTVSSSQIVDADPAAAGSLVHFTVTFSEPVTGVDAGDFTLTTTGVTGAAVTGLSGSEAAYTVTVNTGTVGAVNGTVRLNVVDNDSIRDLYNNPLGGAGAGNGSFITGESYTVAAHVGTPSLLSPARNSITNQSPLTFTWSAVTDAARYEIMFAEDSGFTQNPASHSVTDPTFAGSLPEGKSYWRVRAYNALDEPGNWSASRSFTLDTTGPVAPTLRSPADAATVRNVPIFRWNAVSDAVLYEFQLDNDSNFSSPLVSVEQRTPSRKPAGGLRGTYSWRVRARDAAGNWGAWSSIFTVTITPSRPSR